MKKSIYWLLCLALIAPAIMACGCSSGTTMTPQAVTEHMKAKEKKEQATFKQQ